MSLTIDTSTKLCNALKRAKNDSLMIPYSADSLTIWCDGSYRTYTKGEKPGRRVQCGAGVVWRRQCCGRNYWWRQRAYCLDVPNIQTDDAELFGIQAALEVASDEAALRFVSDSTDNGPPKTRLKTIKIYSDSRAALCLLQNFLSKPLQEMRSFKANQSIRYQILRRVQYVLFRLDKLFQADVSLLYVPAHQGVGGNEMADAAARRATQEKIRRDETGSPLSNVMEGLKEGLSILQTFMVHFEDGKLVETLMESIAEDSELLHSLTSLPRVTTATQSH